MTLCTASASQGQAWNAVPGGNVIGGTEYLGARAGSTVPLRFTTIPNLRMEWRTANIQRMLLNGTVSYPIGATGNQASNGFLGLCANGTLWNGNVGPFTRLHLNDGGVPQQASYRGWMKNGITFTGNQDHSYVGQKFGNVDFTDMVIHWSDNPGIQLKDHLRFLFTSGSTPGAQVGADSPEGLESMRIFPVRNDEAYIGLGDFFAETFFTGTPVEPNERLDVLNGRVRVRKLPDDINEAQGPFRVVVADNTAAPDPERGVLKWRDPNQLDCKWTLATGFLNHVYTAVGPIGVPCPDDYDAVGIGLNLQDAQSPGKLAVKSTQYSKAVHVDQLSTEPIVQGLGVEVAGGTTTTTGIHVQTEQGSASGAQNRGVDISAVGTGAVGNSWNYGLVANVVGSSSRTRGITANTFGGTVTGYAGWFQAFDPAPWVYGLSGQARGGQRRIGVEGLSVGSDLNQIGVMGASTPGAGNWPIPLNVPYIGTAGFARRTDTTTYAIGVYGNAVGPFYADSLNTTAWAGYFNGVVKATGKMICTELHQVSDASLKTDVAELTGAMAVVNELRPTTYHFAAPAGLDIDLPTQLQYGFLAQEVEEVLPSLVGRSTFLGEVDSLGNVLSAQSTVRTLNYQGLVPVVVAALKEQHATIGSMQEQLAAAQSAIAAMQQQLAACCAAPTDSDQRNGSIGTGAEDEKLTPAQERLLRIAPNPFTDRTTLFCTLERAGRMQLLANSADGRSLMVLSEGQREAGEFQYEWSTEQLGPGVYYITLLLDGEPVVKRAVKVGR